MIPVIFPVDPPLIKVVSDILSRDRVISLSILLMAVVEYHTKQCERIGDDSVYYLLSDHLYSYMGIHEMDSHEQDQEVDMIATEALKDVIKLYKVIKPHLVVLDKQINVDRYRAMEATINFHALTYILEEI